ncbi:MAG: recombinase family protein, partial [Clostridia bacterium]|nr:recombinase family protein [Clostridia bacterium]
SIAYQTEHIENYCKENDITLLKIYKDEAQSGTNTERAGFQSLIRDAKTGLFDTVVIYDISRGSRDVGDWFTFRKLMLGMGIQVISVSQKLGDITNSADFLFELISVGMGQTEVLNNRQKSIDGVAVKAKQGVFLGGTPPLGYDVVNGNYVINTAEARTVRKIFEMYAAGHSYDDILNALKGVKGKLGRPLGKNSFSTILRNERYIGTYTWNKRKVKLLRKWAGGIPNPDCVRIEDSIPPIIEKSLWEEVQKRLNANKNATNKAKRTYLLSGLIKCDACGATFVGHTTKNSKGYEHSSYVCGNKYRTHTCNAKNIKAAELETFVCTLLKDTYTIENVEAMTANIMSIAGSATTDLKAEKKELAEINKKIENGVKAILAGMELKELQNEIDALKVRKSELEDIIYVAERKTPQINEKSIKKLLSETAEEIQKGNITPEIVKTYHNRNIRPR